MANIYAAGDTYELGNFSVMSCQHAIPLDRHAGNNAAADLIGVAPRVYSQSKYVTCLDLGAWGAVYTEGWERQQKLVGAEAKTLKRQINTLWIYPPAADRVVAQGTNHGCGLNDQAEVKLIVACPLLFRAPAL